MNFKVMRVLGTCQGTAGSLPASSDREHPLRATQAPARVHRQLDELDVALRDPAVARVGGEQRLAIAVAQELEPERRGLLRLLAEEEEEAVEGWIEEETLNWFGITEQRIAGRLEST